MCRTTPCAEFKEDLVDGLSLGYGPVDNFAVNVIVDHDALRGTVTFVGVGYKVQCPPSEEAEDMRGDFQHLSIHATQTSTLRRNVSLIAEIATDCWWRRDRDRRGGFFGRCWARQSQLLRASPCLRQSTFAGKDCGKKMASRLLPRRAMSRSGGTQQHCILAIDDEAGFLGFLKAALECQGHAVHTASNPEEAIRFYEERWREIDMVLLDYLLPPIWGNFVFDELQRLNPDVRVVLLTGCDESVADDLFEKGLRGYLQKPFKLPDLARKVEEAIRAPSPSPAASPSPG
jgi:CheY-like chemotaxis protein